MEKRTFEEFVEEALERGRTRKQILTIAAATRWQPYLQQIKEHIEKVEKFFRKIK